MLSFQYEPEFAEYANLQTVLGDCDIAQLENADRIVVSPGVPLEEYALSALMKSVILTNLTSNFSHCAIRC